MKVDDTDNYYYEEVLGGNGPTPHGSTPMVLVGDEGFSPEK